MHYRTVFISDIHLGSAACRHDLALDALCALSFDKLVIAGDLIDYDMRRSPIFWRQGCSRLLAQIHRLACDGVEVVMVPGNHDDYLRAYAGARAMGASLELTHVHVLADGRRALVTHGDIEEGTPTTATTANAALGYLSDMALTLNRPIDALRRLGGLPAIDAFAKARMLSGAFRDRVALFESRLEYARVEAGCDVVVCGHIHVPKIGATYVNLGDWTESMTLVVESTRGTLSLIPWRRIGG